MKKKKKEINRKNSRKNYDHSLDGVEITKIEKSVYPNGSLASQVLGFIGTDAKGLEGMEALYDKDLKKTEGKYLIKKDKKGRVVYSEIDVNADYDGADVVLTIDRNIQFIAETELKKSVEKYEAKSAMAIVMNPKTGEILAMANYPTYNPNNFNATGNHFIWRNRTVTDIFEPGSTLKIFIAATAIDLGYYNEETLFDCENGKYVVDGHEINDTRPHKWMSLEQIIRLSSNIGIVKVAEVIRREKIYEFLSDFGFGKKTNVGCAAETIGKFRHFKKWTNFDTAAISYGQGIGVSAIQLVSAASALANNGVLMKPHIVKSIKYKNPVKIVKTEIEESKKIISSKTAKTVISMMDKVINNNGTGRKAASKKVRLCGKTGTAQKADDKGGMSEDNYIASFLGFAPTSDPKFAILVVVDEPKKSHQGGEVAAPAFKNIAIKSLEYMKNAKISKLAFDRDF